MSRLRVGLVAAAALIATSASPAGAAVQVGRTIAPTGLCGSGFTRLQTSSSGLYTVPSPGVFTAWSFQAAATPPMLQLKVARPVGGTNFTIVGESATETMSANALRTFSVRIPVQAGDVIGSYQAGGGECSVLTTGFTFRFLVGNQMAGTTANFTGSGAANTELPLSATLEPDGDHDDFGDETQDKCVGTAGTANGCPSTVTIDTLKQKGAKPKLKVMATVPGAGTLKAGSASDPALASPAGKSKSSLKPVTQTLTSTTKQQVVLTLKLTKSARQKLADEGKLKLQVRVIYVPPGGPAASQTKKAKLKS